MSMMKAGNGAGFRRYSRDLPGSLRAGEATRPCRIDEVSATGVTLRVDECAREGALPADVAVIIPSLGQYRARRAWHSGDRAAYLFDLTEFSQRALDVLLAERFGDQAAVSSPPLPDDVSSDGVSSDGVSSDGVSSAGASPA